MGSPFTVTSVSNYNSNPPSDDGAQTAANRVQWSTQKTKLTDPLKTAFDDSETETSTAFGRVLGGGGITTTAVDYTVSASDQGKFVKVTASGKTITTPDATVVGSPFVFAVLNNSSGNITLDGSGSQTIDGVSSFTIPAGAGVLVNTDGTNWFTSGKNFFQGGTGITIDTSTSPATIKAVLNNYLSGLTMSTGGGSGNMVIASGQASDSTNTSLMSFSGLTKTTASWIAGNGGGLDTGSIGAGGWYHFYLIQRPDTGAVDAIFSASASAPSLPANYTLYRRIGSAKTDGSNHWIAFVQFGDDFLWLAPPQDISTSSLTAAPTNFALGGVPTGVKVWANITGAFSNATNGISLLIQSPDATGAGPSTTTGLITARVQAAGIATAFVDNIRTDTSAQITAYASAASSTLNVSTKGWRDLRGKT
jgi:hypothetical protein